ncbi:MULTISPECIES: methionine ABC transporter ATP-binding protein [unclassified Granulicatella]|uniref:methionine ABC transporter ATP-binding protein n=1 Tax=unclassified Granulicatella TaxID=2630493 RepID=UPI0010732F07|nr:MULTISPECIES: ATP-binding cassette domain-containing protein [unclassified Granulicatella]MBF0780448.1 ATP-binding cassette domain-containing protein [Granulicatella sp. 19428wC4_WM01]TFU95392.1 ATP-binding cassette domain-containing protein [Granulicatella sp. WM01]
MITLQNIDVTFEQNQKQIHAVKQVSLQINRGDIYGIIGYSGAGKSTLVRTINLLQRPTNEGKVIVSDTDLTSLNAKQLREARKKIGMIFQHFNLMNSISVFSNVAFPLKKSGLSEQEIIKKVNKLLKLVGLEDKADAYPRQLSGGQKQRVAIARALANDPHVLLCDEATSALDPKTTYSILELLKQVNQKLGITIVIITHEMQVVKEVCNRVAVMEKGEVIEEGSILNIFTHPERQLTKDFIDTATHINKGIETILHHEKLLNLKQGDVLAKISFVGSSTGDPLITKLSTHYNVAANILFGNVEIIQETPIGTLLVVLSGQHEDIAGALSYIEQNQATLEILEDLRGGQI